ncbi:hypothetical protein D6_0078 [Aeromonas phage D6]|uniref:Virion structural protein n=1 Tax=Aeromonas phage D6 TaxID=2593322 RepID=A0A514TW33_9CAUD|nr:hypothetical protein PQC08_gp197 [Aeromonas phage D6]QDJ97238.1 hypothetical protein D6_0078 [Aeromonas phage D6]
MIGIDFIRPRADFGPMGFSGLEFLDKQTDTVFRQLVTMFQTMIKQDQHGQNVLDWDNADRQEISDYLLDATGMKIIMMDGTNTVGNAAIEAGYFSPNNLINSTEVDKWLDVKHTNVAQALRTLKVDVMSGWIDTSTGKVGGDLSKIEFKLYIQSYLDMFLVQKRFAKWGANFPELLASIVLHEMGHAWTAMVYAFQTCFDSLFPIAAVRLAMNAKGEREKVTIIKEAKAALEIPENLTDKDLEVMADPEGLTLYFKKAIETRNLRRTLSLGVSARNAESFADIYAVRMGASKELVIALASLPGAVPMWVPTWFMVAAVLGSMVGSPFIVGYAGTMAVLMTLVSLAESLRPGDTYDTPYRRIKAILREMVAEFQNSKHLSNNDKRRLLNQCKDMAKLIEDQKPMLEGTAVQRMVGWIFSGSDFKAQDFEHYTHEIMSHNLSLYEDFFKSDKE